MSGHNDHPYGLEEVKHWDRGFDYRSRDRYIENQMWRDGQERSSKSKEIVSSQM